MMLVVGCNARTESSDTITHGMKWSIAQRDLEQNRWTSTVTKPNLNILRSVNGGAAYRYRSPTGDIVHVVTEQVGEIAKLYRIFDGNGTEIDVLHYKTTIAK